jgi:hypothetical protein
MGTQRNPANVNYRVVAVSRPPPRPDFDGDGVVTAGDVAAFVEAWGAGDADVDGDGETNTADLLSFLCVWSGSARAR